MPNDIDLLFVYTQYNYTAATKLKETKKMLESILKIDVDVVALSLNEVNETHFLSYFIKLPRVSLFCVK